MYCFPYLLYDAFFQNYVGVNRRFARRNYGVSPLRAAVKIKAFHLQFAYVVVQRVRRFAIFFPNGRGFRVATRQRLYSNQATFIISQEKAKRNEKSLFYNDYQQILFPEFLKIARAFA